jgi:hypothetical protein
MRPTENLEKLFESKGIECLGHIIQSEYIEIKSNEEHIIHIDDDKIEYLWHDNEEGHEIHEKYSKKEKARECVRNSTEMFIKILNDKMESYTTNKERIEYLDVIQLQLHSTVEKGILRYKIYEDIIKNITSSAFKKIIEYNSVLGVIASNESSPKQLNWQGQQNQLAQLFKNLMDNPSENKGKPFFSNTNDEVIEFILKHITCKGNNLNLADFKRLSADLKVPKQDSSKEITLKKILK